MTGRKLALIGYFGNLGLLPAWYGWLAPMQWFSRTTVLVVLLIPMLAPLRGILQGRPYTYAWSGFIALLFFTHGVVEAYSNAAARMYASLEILLCGMWFCGAILYVRQARGQINKGKSPAA